MSCLRTDPKDIRRACDEIQATWSPRQRAKRDRGPRATWWTVPMIRVSDIVTGETETTTTDTTKTTPAVTPDAGGTTTERTTETTTETNT